MTGLRRLFFAALFALATWRGQRHTTLAQIWRNRAFNFNRKAKENRNAEHTAGYGD